MTTTPLLSIITPCLNRSAFIADAVESVLKQDYQNFEHVIMDGGSTDATLSILAGYPRLLVFSEKDEGMYHALNKGIEKARGQIIGLLNSDDMYEPGIFSTVIEEFQEHPKTDVVTGMASYFQENNKVQTVIKTLPAVTAENFEYALMRGVPIINAWFFRRDVFERLGPFDQSFLIAADRDFQARCLIHQIKIRSLDRFFYHYRHHQGSMTVNNDLVKQEEYLSENLRVAEKYGHMGTVNSKHRRKFINWQDLILFEIFISNMRRKNFQKSFKIMISAIKEKPARLVVYAAQFPVRLIYYLHRIIKEAFAR